MADDSIRAEHGPHDSKYLASGVRNLANARLIASAPELLAALQSLLPAAEWAIKRAPDGTRRNQADFRLVAVREAIAKATGA